MPDEQGKAEVRPIYRKGDRVLVKLLTGFCAFVIQEFEYMDRELWFYEVSCCLMMYFPFASVVGRLDAGEVLSWSNLS